MWLKTTNDASKIVSLFNSYINTGHMSYRTQRFCDLSFYSCNSGISFASPRTWACGLGLLWTWMVHEIFACLAYWRGTISFNYFIYQSKLLLQEFWNSLMIYHYQVRWKQHDFLQVQHPWHQKAESACSCFLIHYMYTNVIV